MISEINIIDIGNITRYLFFVYRALSNAIDNNGVKLGANGIILIKTPTIKNKTINKYFIYLNIVNGNLSD